MSKLPFPHHSARRILGSILLALALAASGQMPTPAVAAKPGLERQFQDAMGMSRSVTDAPTSAPVLPDAMARSMAIGLQQSAYRVADIQGGALVITYTLANLRPPAIGSDPVTTTGTVTETLNAMLAFDALDDPNTIRGVLLSDVLTPGLTLLSSSRAFSQSGAAFMIGVGDIPPLGSVTVTIRLSAPTLSNDFQALDSGSQAFGTLQGRMIRVSATPITLAPDAFGLFLRWTPDADTNDPVMLQKNGEIGGSGQSLFEFVRNLRNDVYSGSLRGTRGTLWGEGGNSVDKSSLLIAMLRGRGIPARYRHGTLDISQAKQVISSMFPARSRLTGYLPSGAPVADPLNDTVLLSEAGDHWWVEAYLSGQGWMNLDPTFATASVGDVFAGALALDGTDRIAELPDLVRHKVTVRLRAERYNVLSGLSSIYPISHTFLAAQLGSHPVVLGHFVKSESQGGFIFSNSFNEYSPYLFHGDEVITGTIYQDFASNFAGPLVNQSHIAAWLQFDVIAPNNGGIKHYEREIVDRLGAAARLNGGTAAMPASGGAAVLFTSGDTYATWFLANQVPQSAFIGSLGKIRNSQSELASVSQRAQQLLSITNPNPQQLNETSAVVRRMLVLQGDLMATAVLNYGWLAGEGIDAFAAGYNVRAYASEPQIVTVGSRQVMSNGVASAAATIDLRKVNQRVIGYPGQSIAAMPAVRFSIGLAQSGWEGIALANILGGDVWSTVRVLEEAGRQGMQILFVDDANFSRLKENGHSDVTLARVLSAIKAGKTVVISERPVMVNGISHNGWFEVTSMTGETIGVMENGLHGAIEYLVVLGKGGGMGAIIVAFVVGLLVGIASGIAARLAAKTRAPGPAVDFIGGLAAIFTLMYLNALEVTVIKFCLAFSGLAGKLACGAAFAAGRAIGLAIVRSIPGDPPVLPFLTSLPLEISRPSSVGTQMAVVHQLDGREIVASLDVPNVVVTAAFYAPSAAGLAIAGNQNGFIQFGNAGATSLVSGSTMVGPGSGALTVGGTPMMAGNGLAIGNYSGAIAISEQSQTTDRIILNGTGDAFALSLSPSSNSLDPLQSQQISATITSNFDDAFTTTVDAAAGLIVTITNSGQISVFPAAGTPSGLRILLVTTRSSKYPTLFASAIHTVSINAFHGMEIQVEPDAFTTVPWGPELHSDSIDETNNGRPQVSGAAYHINITNTSNTTHTFGITVTGLPAGWTLISGENYGTSATSLTLPAGAPGQLGLYISPTLMSMPPAGSPYPFSVQAIALDMPSLGASDSVSFTIPPLAYAYASFDAPTYFGAPGSVVTMGLAVRNVGNIDGTFPLSYTTPVSNWLASGPASVFVGANNVVTLPILVNVTGTLGSERAVKALVQSGPYTLTTSAAIRLTTAGAAEAYRLAELAAGTPTVAGAIGNIAAAMGQLESNPADAAAKSALLNSVDALLGVISDLRDSPGFVQLTAAALALAGHTDPTDIRADLAQIRAALGAILGELDLRARLALSSWFSPGSVATLPNAAVRVTLNLQNRGNQTNTISTTLAGVGLSGSSGVIVSNIAPGVRITHEVVISAATQGVYALLAQSVVLSGALPSSVASTAAANVRIVDAFVRVLGVNASPAFVDSGTSSTTVRSTLANVPNIALPAVAELTVVHASGGISSTILRPLVVGTGNPQEYVLGELTTSGWASGIYTLAVRILDAQGQLIPQGSGSGTLVVGRGVTIDHSVNPALVPPGNMTSTIVITTKVRDGLIGEHLPGAAKVWAAPARFLDGNSITRSEEVSLTVSGAWTLNNVVDRASGGRVHRSSTVSTSAVITLSASWIGVGLIGGSDGRVVDVYVDGAKLDSVDTYRRSEEPIARYYTVGAGTHVISLSVSAEFNPLNTATTKYARIDFVDAWDGTTAPDGVFEHVSSRVRLSSNWTTTTLGIASAGTFGAVGAGSQGTAWFGFTGDSFALQGIADNSTSQLIISVDGQYLGMLDFEQWSSVEVTRSFGFSGFASGPHVVEVRRYRGAARLDAFMTPASGPAFVPPSGTGFRRYEEDDAALRYNGLPLTQTTTAWELPALTRASRGQLARNSSLTQTASLTFTGQWVAVGFGTDTTGRMVELFVDGVSQGTVDTYSRVAGVLRKTLPAIGSGTHTISMTTLPTSNPFNTSLTKYILLDYIETWDGSMLDAAVVNHDAARVLRSDNWTQANSVAALSGTNASVSSDDTLWFPFTGESFAYTGLADNGASVVLVGVDDTLLGMFDFEQFSSTDITRTLAFTGLGSGAHVGWVQRLAGSVWADTFAAPADAPFHTTAPVEGIRRYEENDPQLRFNGAPFTATAQTWSWSGNSAASSGFVAASYTVSDTTALTFTGTWATVGFAAGSDGRIGEVFIDGVSMGEVDTYARVSGLLRRSFAGLGAGTHTLSVTARSAFNPNNSSTFKYLRLDYIDISHSAMPAGGLFDHDHPRVWHGTSLIQAGSVAAQNGTYAYVNGAQTLWLPFDDTSFSVTALTDNSVGRITIGVDDQELGTFDLYQYSATDMTRTYVFTGLASGPHVAWVERNRGELRFDTFAVPALTQSYTPTLPGAIQRLEEDHPAWRYDGQPLTATTSLWNIECASAASDGCNTWITPAAHTITLAFTGTWLALGFVSAPDGRYGEVFIDGVSRGTVDSYSRVRDVLRKTYTDLSAGPHVLSVVVQSGFNPLATAGTKYFRFDYADTWDGTDIPDGFAGHNRGRAFLSSGWTETTDVDVVDGDYIYAFGSGPNIWFPFSGDSVSLNMVTDDTRSRPRVWVDDVLIDTAELWHNTSSTNVGLPRTFSYAGFGPGPHMLRVQSFRVYASVDGITTPGTPPFANPSFGPVRRFEEDDAALRFNGQPLDLSTPNWTYENLVAASTGWLADSSIPSDTISLTFAGTWLAIGTFSNPNGRRAQVYVDGAPITIIDTYSSTIAPQETIVGGLLGGTHVVSIQVLSAFNASATGSTKYFRFDYLDTWDGTSLEPGIYQDTHQSVSQSDDWNRADSASAMQGSFVEDGSNLWFHVEGDSFALIGFSDTAAVVQAEVIVDGVSRGIQAFQYAFARSPISHTISGLGGGLHHVRIVDRSGGTRRSGIDGYDTANRFRGVPLVEWHYFNNDGGYLQTTPAVADLDGDGLPEVIGVSNVQGFFSANGSTLYVFNGNGADGGFGNAVRYSRTLTGTDGTSAAAIADFGDGPRIIIAGGEGMRAFDKDGTQLWLNPKVRGTWYGAPAIGNMDADPAPEIVNAGGETSPYIVSVVEADGSVSKVYTLPTTSPGPRMPALADMNGDGKLDIIVPSGRTLYVLGTASPGPTATLMFTGAGLGNHYGAPAIVDLDRDGSPEIVVGWDGGARAYNNDGSIRWTYVITDAINASSVSAADLDGDGWPELALYMKTNGPAANESGRIFALRRDGSLLWSALAKDTTQSSAGLSVLDLNGDGEWELVWNGYISGTLILAGRDGRILFNDPNINSGTINEVPTIADVDNDGHAEVVLVDREGLYVLGFDNGWASSRPLWNQHNYHITNINDDLTVPSIEPNSWVYHNTYRTQSPLLAPLPAYRVEITHTLATSGVALIAGSATPTPTTQVGPALGWRSTQYSYEAARVHKLTVTLDNMQPGEVRKVSEGTLMNYTVASGSNSAALGPLFVVAPRLAGLTPASRTVEAGEITSYTLVLQHVGAAATVYTLTQLGLPGGWSSLPITVALDAASRVTLTVSIRPYADADAGSYPFAIAIGTPQGAQDQVSAEVIVRQRFMAMLLPREQSAASGARITYTLIVSNPESSAQVYQLAPNGLDDYAAQLPASIAVAANATATASLTFGAPALQTNVIFGVSVTNASGSVVQPSALLRVVGSRSVSATFVPTISVTGRSTPRALTLVVTNTGTLFDDYDLALALPADWSGYFARSGTMSDVQTLAPAVLNDVQLRVWVNANGAPAGLYPVTATITSRNAPARVVAVGYVEVLSIDVHAAITPREQTASPMDDTQWTLRITNTGQVAETYVLTVANDLGNAMRLSAPQVTLNAGAATDVPFSIESPEWALPGAHTVQVGVWSQSQPAVAVYPTATLNIVPLLASQAVITPLMIALSSTAPGFYLLTLTNTGNVDDEYVLSPGNSGALVLALTVDRVYVPAHASVDILVEANAPAPGTYPFDVVARSVGNNQNLRPAAQLVIAGGPIETPTSTPTATASPTSTATATPISTSTPTTTPTTTPAATPSATPTLAVPPRNRKVNLPVVMK